ncbi:ABC transporter permease [Rhodoferax sp.]|uniref:ABC transporter permease n=1 Tax=Rhodoferax sp. TaxID=50421 RepID=UPI00283CD2F8|nr:ABC transporter permease [Rhodoferax sp.]MDR3367808.1 ABC transporter permease [Rhodoferax sp.]
MQGILNRFMRIGSDPAGAGRALMFTLGIPLVSLVLFMALWGAVASNIQTSLGVLPGPVQVLAQTKSLWDDYLGEQARRSAFYERQEKRNAELKAQDPSYEPVIRAYTGKPTYLAQILTSLKTVFAGFLLATLVAVPLGILAGSSRFVQAAINPIVQIFRPVSPLAWLPIVTLLVSALYVTHGEPMFEKSFLVSAITVTLCSLWPTLINTAIGVTSVDRDLVNVGRVLKLPLMTRVRKIILPSALPFIFAGMRISLGVGWMVLIAAEMLAQNPGLGKFVWDEFQNGSSDSLSRIIVAVFTIGLIGFGLDRIMQLLQDLSARR